MKKFKLLLVSLSALLLMSCSPDANAEVHHEGAVINTFSLTDIENSIPEISGQENVETSDYPANHQYELSGIPPYDGETPYIEIHGNIPNFTAEDLQKDVFCEFSPLDELGRCGVANAVIGVNTMPTGERGEIGMIKPSGWQTPQQKYDFVDGKFLYNRCHLIGWQFFGDDTNVSENLITGTRYLNVTGMLPLENEIAEYVKKTHNHVRYRVTPVFIGNNLVADGVLMEAMSLEDKGQGIRFSIFCYNVQPKVTIDYASGKSMLADSTTEAVSKMETTEVAEFETDASKDYPVLEDVTDISKYQYIVNISSKKVHRNTCSNVQKMSHKNMRGYNGPLSDLTDAGYVVAKDCM